MAKNLLVNSRGNTRIESYEQAKWELTKIHKDHKITIYCGFSYNDARIVDIPEGFNTSIFPNRADRMEREHVVPAENFGRTFKEWRDGHPMCVNSKGKPFKGRRCVKLANSEFNFMEADLHNLFPSVGSVNATRSNYNFDTLTKNVEMPFGSLCPIKMMCYRHDVPFSQWDDSNLKWYHNKDNCKLEPPDRAKGMVARAYRYMDFAYKRYNMSRSQRKLMEIWDRTHPPDKWEIERNRRIKEIQGNGNPFIEHWEYYNSPMKL